MSFYDLLDKLTFEGGFLSMLRITLVKQKFSEGFPSSPIAINNSISFNTVFVVVS